MAAGGAPDACESVREVAAPKKSGDRVLPVPLPRAIGFLEAVAVDAFELVEVLDDELVKRRRFRVVLAVESRCAFHGGEEQTQLVCRGGLGGRNSRGAHGVAPMRR